MKTTIEIADSLLAAAKQVATNDATTLRALVDEGLRLALEQRRVRRPFRLRRASFRGKGLRPELAGVAWNRLRELAYEDRA